MTPPDSASAGHELRKVLNILFDDGRIAYANDKSPDVCEQYIDRAEAMVNAYILAEVLAITQKEFKHGESSAAFDSGREYEQFRIKQAAIARFGKGGNRG